MTNWMSINIDVSWGKNGDSVFNMDVKIIFPAGHHDAARGGELPASVPQRDAAGQQRGVHEGEGQRSTKDAEGV